MILRLLSVSMDRKLFKSGFFVDIDGGGYNKTTELQTISSDGTYKYKAEITDLAGKYIYNSS